MSIIETKLFKERIETPKLITNEILLNGRTLNDTIFGDNIDVYLIDTRQELKKLGSTPTHYAAEQVLGWKMQVNSLLNGYQIKQVTLRRCDTNGNAYALSNEVFMFIDCLNQDGQILQTVFSGLPKRQLQSDNQQTTWAFEDEFFLSSDTVELQFYFSSVKGVRQTDKTVRSSCMKVGENGGKLYIHNWKTLYPNDKGWQNYTTDFAIKCQKIYSGLQSHIENTTIHMTPQFIERVEKIEQISKESEEINSITKESLQIKKSSISTLIQGLVATERGKGNAYALQLSKQHFTPTISISEKYIIEKISIPYYGGNLDQSYLCVQFFNTNEEVLETQFSSNKQSQSGDGENNFIFEKLQVPHDYEFVRIYYTEDNQRTPILGNTLQQTVNCRKMRVRVLSLSTNPNNYTFDDDQCQIISFIEDENGNINKQVSNWRAYIDTEVLNYTNHFDNTDIHVTLEDKERWDNSTVELNAGSCIEIGENNTISVKTADSLAYDDSTVPTTKTMYLEMGYVLTDAQSYADDAVTGHRNQSGLHTSTLLQNRWNGHVDDDTIHVTSDDKTEISKITPLKTLVDSHIGDATHITQEEKDKISSLIDVIDIETIQYNIDTRQLLPNYTGFGNESSVGFTMTVDQSYREMIVDELHLRRNDNTGLNEDELFIYAQCFNSNNEQINVFYSTDPDTQTSDDDKVMTWTFDDFVIPNECSSIKFYYTRVRGQMQTDVSVRTAKLLQNGTTLYKDGWKTIWPGGSNKNITTDFAIRGHKKTSSVIEHQKDTTIHLSEEDRTNISKVTQLEYSLNEHIGDSTHLTETQKTSIGKVDTLETNISSHIDDKNIHFEKSLIIDGVQGGREEHVYDLSQGVSEISAAQGIAYVQICSDHTLQQGSLLKTISVPQNHDRTDYTNAEIFLVIFGDTTGNDDWELVTMSQNTCLQIAGGEDMVFDFGSNRCDLGLYKKYRLFYVTSNDTPPTLPVTGNDYTGVKMAFPARRIDDNCMAMQSNGTWVSRYTFPAIITYETEAQEAVLHKDNENRHIDPQFKSDIINAISSVSDLTSVVETHINDTDIHITVEEKDTLARLAKEDLISEVEDKIDLVRTTLDEHIGDFEEHVYKYGLHLSDTEKNISRVDTKVNEEVTNLQTKVNEAIDTLTLFTKFGQFERFSSLDNPNYGVQDDGKMNATAFDLSREHFTTGDIKTVEIHHLDGDDVKNIILCAVIFKAGETNDTPKTLDDCIYSTNTQNQIDGNYSGKLIFQFDNLILPDDYEFVRFFFAKNKTAYPANNNTDTVHSVRVQVLRNINANSWDEYDDDECKIYTTSNSANWYIGVSCSRIYYPYSDIKTIFERIASLETRVIELENS